MTYFILLLIPGTSEVMVLVSVSGVVKYKLDKKTTHDESFHQSFVLALNSQSDQKNACNILSDCFRSMKSTK